MADRVLEVAPERANITATTTISSIKAFAGVFVSSNSAGTLKVADSGGNIFNTFTPEGGKYYYGACVTNGSLVVTITGTMDCTVFYER